jgi:hypothetical protein
VTVSPWAYLALPVLGLAIYAAVGYVMRRRSR